MCARSQPSASSTAIASSVMSSEEYAPRLRASAANGLLPPVSGIRVDSPASRWS